MKLTSINVVTLLFVLNLFGVSFFYNYGLDLENICEGDLECLSLNAVDDLNPSLCESSLDKEACYDMYILKSGDYLACKYSSNISNCYVQNAVLRSNVTLCDETEDLNNCIFQISVSSRNASYCGSLNDSSLCYYSYAFAFKNLSYCDLSEKYKRTCYDKLNRTE